MPQSKRNLSNQMYLGRGVSFCSCYLAFGQVVFSFFKIECKMYDMVDMCLSVQSISFHKIQIRVQYLLNNMRIVWSKGVCLVLTQLFKPLFLMSQPVSVYLSNLFLIYDEKNLNIIALNL